MDNSIDKLILNKCKKCRLFDKDRERQFNDGSKVPFCSHPFFHYKDGTSMLDVEEEFIKFLLEFKYCLFFEKKDEDNSTIIEVDFKK